MQEDLAAEQQVDSGEVEQTATDGEQEQNQAEEQLEFEVESVDQGESPSPKGSDNAQYHILERLKRKQNKEGSELSRQQQDYIKQLEAQAQQSAPPQSDAFPTWDNFEGSESELETKRAEWNQRQITKTVNQQLMQQQQGAQIAARQQQQEDKLNDYATAADALRVSNFNQLQDKAIDVIGQDLAQVIVNSVGGKDAALIMCNLGTDSATALELKQLYDVNPGAATFKLGQLSASTNLKPKNKAPDPEARVESAVAQGVQSSYDKQKAKILKQLDDKKMSSNDAISKLRELRQAQAN